MARSFQILAIVLAAALLHSCRSDPTSVVEPVGPEYFAEIDAWHADRLENLRSETGWLSVVGLHWLNEGEQSFGSDPGNDIVFPEQTASRIGVFRVAEGQVTIIVEPGIEVTSAGEPVEELLLAADVTGEATELELHSLLFYAIRRGDRVGIRVKDRRSPALASFAGIDRYPVEARWRKQARFERYDEPKTLKVPNVLGQITDQACEGAVVFEIEGESYRLDGISEDGGDLFLIFGDQTNGKGTYGAGRFLYTDPPAEDGTVVVDFNRAYNPPCAFTPFATCPLPPSQNKLTVLIEAGEQDYGDH